VKWTQASGAAQRCRIEDSTRELPIRDPQEKLTATLKAELEALKRSVRDDDQLANEQLPNGVDGTVARLRGK
jgi:hypothetical protein